MSLDVIGAGFGRTGTLSMKVALERLGYNKTHHMHEVLRSPRQAELWHQVSAGSNTHWPEVFDGYQACVDFPSAPFYRELHEAYPNAMVVLTIRDVDRWYNSTSETIFKMSQLTPRWTIRLIPHVRRLAELTDATVWDGIFDGRFDDEEYAKTVFADHIADVTAAISPNRLLTFNVAEGWEPLCEFLGCEVPDEPFPHLNDAAAFQRKIRLLHVVRAMPAIIAAVCLLLLVVLRLDRAVPV
ncbi:hypothetical protein JYT71_00430 [Acidimicrobiaceae bacterium AH-315-P05]|nr:hypothetical protein [Acidimicrobiaceae bacterium AH-315-P05]